MSTVVKDLGAVSAYAYAVEKGYTGTDAEFAELMASYAEVGQTATTAAQTATTKAGEAQTSAQTASSKASEATTAAATATTAKDDAVSAKTAAETAQGKAEDAQAAAESVAESIPSDYSQLSEDVSDLKEGLSAMSTATSSDVGKALKVKTVTDGKVSEWEFGAVGSPTDSALSPTSENPVQNKVINGMFGNLSALSQYGSSVADILSYIINEIEHSIDPNDIDVCLFAGQSNMDGRGTESEATPVTTGKAYKWDNANNTLVDFAAEPSLIPAYMQEYTTLSRVPLVEVKEAIGGTDIEEYINNYLPTAITMLTRCITYLEGQGKNIRRVFMLWNQGENDVTYTGLTNLTAEQYEAFFATLKSSVMQAGVERIFVINIGQTKNLDADFSQIRLALQNVCDGTTVIMASDKFYNATDYMKDSWHYTQIVYNVVGKDAAKNTVAIFSGQTPTIKHFDASDVDGVPTEYGTLDDWTYELVNAKVLLNSYVGSNPNVRVYKHYILDGYFYEARIKTSTGGGGSDAGCFGDNSTLVSVTIDDGVRMMNPNGKSDADNVQSFYRMFQNNANLETVTVPSSFPNLVHCGSMFRGASKINSCSFQDKLHDVDDASYAFSATAITSYGDVYASYSVGNIFANCTSIVSVGDIKGSYRVCNAAFQGCTNLETVGIIESTAVTNINQMFLNCTKLAGTVRFEATGITQASNAFYNCDLSKITIEVPANSTTYTTLSTAYPSANIVTF